MVSTAILRLVMRNSPRDVTRATNRSLPVRAVRGSFVKFELMFALCVFVFELMRS